MMNHLEALQRQAVVQEVQEWLGTPFHHQGRVKGVGVDCAMLLAEVFERAGLIPRLTPEPYSAQWHLHRREEVLLGVVLQFGHEITGPPLPGDVVLYQFGHCLSHAAIVTEWPRIIHAVAGSCVKEGNGLLKNMVIRGHQPTRSAFFSYWGLR